MTFAQTQEQLKTLLGETGFTSSTFRDNHRLVIPVEKVHDALKCLKEKCGFDQLIDVTAVDYLNYPNSKDRFGVVYCLLNTHDGQRVIVKTFVNNPTPCVSSCYDLWKAADWLEREVFDMFGITFTGHPDLRRLLMPEAFTAYPLRKDYPLRGKGERHNFPVITRAEG